MRQGNEPVPEADYTLIKNQDLLVVGPKALTRNITSWLSCSPFAQQGQNP